MKPAVLAALAIGAILLLAGTLVSSLQPAVGQGQSAVSVRNALVMLVPQNSPALSTVIDDGGTPSGIQNLLGQAEQLLSVQVPRGMTNATGYFTINAPGGTAYNLTVSAPGYVQAISNTVSVGAGMASIPKDFAAVVQPSAIISGTVTDESGNPISGIVVSAGSGPDSGNYDVTMDNGVFVLDTGLATGNHTIYAFKPSNANFAQVSRLFNQSGIAVPQQEARKLLFDPPASGYSVFSTTVNLKEGKLTNLNIRLAKSQEISGTVFDQSSRRPLGGIPILAFDNSGSLIDATSTDQSGHYFFNNGLGQQSYAIVIPSIPALPFAPQGSNVTAPAHDVAFFLHDAGTISGKVVDAKGRGVSGATVIGSPLAGSATQTNVITAALPNFLASSTSPAKTGPDGTFILRGDPQDGGEWFTVHAYFGDALPVSGTGIMVPGTGEPVQISLDFSDSVTVKGMVLDNEDGRPIAGAKVIPSFATSIPASINFAATSGQDGSFTMTVPLKDPSARSLFDSIVVYAPGYAPRTVPIAAVGQTIANMTKSSNIIEGKVVTQATDGIPSVETAIIKKGIVLVQEGNATFPISATTNSKITDASFDSASKKIVIHLEGVQGTQGKSEFTLPADIMTGPYSVSVDGRTLPQSDVTVSQNSTAAIISFNHDHGAREMVIQGVSMVPEFPVPAILAAAGVAAAIFAFKRLRA